jgi:hypothetical protein
MPKSYSGDLRERVIEAWERVHRDVRPLSALRLVPTRRSNGCKLGTITECGAEAARR